MKIGEVIRNIRLERGMSQGDIENRTGLLRCYLSRVENGHTLPSLDTLGKIAGALEVPLSQFFVEPAPDEEAGLPPLRRDERRFLAQVRRSASSLDENGRALLLAIIKKMAAGIGENLEKAAETAPAGE